MKVIIEQEAGKDYPIELKGNGKFYDDIKAVLRKKIGLRDTDTIELREVEL